MKWIINNLSNYCFDFHFVDVIGDGCATDIFMQLMCSLLSIRFRQVILWFCESTSLRKYGRNKSMTFCILQNFERIQPFWSRYASVCRLFQLLISGAFIKRCVLCALPTPLSGDHKNTLLEAIKIEGTNWLKNHRRINKNLQNKYDRKRQWMETTRWVHIYLCTFRCYLLSASTCYVSCFFLSNLRQVKIFAPLTPADPTIINFRCALSVS